MSQNNAGMRQNNFDIVRLMLAIVVVLVHAKDLSGNAALDPIAHVLNARLGVECFFVISGFLIFASYERCSSLHEYFANRAFRILPGYWLSTVVCLLIAFAHGTVHVGRFLIANLLFANFLAPRIPGIFTHNPVGSDLNGALWTIKIEVMFYLSVPLIVWLCRHIQRDVVLWSLIVASLTFHFFVRRHESLAVQLPGQLSFFLVGTLIYYHLNLFRQYGRWFMLGGLILYGVHMTTGWYALRPVPVGVLVLGLCLLFPQVKGPTRWGDFSYGTYVLHWPLIQLMAEGGGFQTHPWTTLFLTIMLVGFLAVLSWNLLEKPALAHAKSYRLRRSAIGKTPNYPAAVP